MEETIHYYMVRPAVFSSKKIQLCSKTCQNNPSRIWLFLLRLYKNIFSYVYLYMTNHPGLELKKLLDSHFHGSVVALFKQKLSAGRLTRSEDPANHCCVYCAVCDYKQNKFYWLLYQVRFVAF